MIYPLLQAFVSMILSAQRTLVGPVLGVIEGVAESTASLLKVFSGYYSDRIQKRKAPAITGYGMSALSRFLLFAAGSGWIFVLLFRFLDRVGKGIRTAPRDALISESTPKGGEGKAFGFHRAMDFAGATLGVLICYIISLRYLDPISGNLRNFDAFYRLFALSIIPAALGVAVLFLIREPDESAQPGKTRPKPNLSWRTYDQNLKRLYLVQILFTIGNSSNQFLLLRSMSLGYALSTVILMYMVFNLCTTLWAMYFGALSDRIGKKRVLIAGYFVYTIVYSAFGFITTENRSMLWGFWILYGLYYAMTEGVEKALVSRLAPEHAKATALGFYHTIVGIGLLPASVIAGFLFSAAPSLPFVFGGIMSLAAVIVLGFVNEYSI